MKEISSVPMLGATGEDIKTYQRALREKGLDTGAIDGIFGTHTKIATSRFQISIGLDGSGVPGPKTLAALGLSVHVTPESALSCITKDLIGKQDRHLHPNKRAQIEAVLFPGGHKIPQCFLDRDIQACYSLVMEKIAGLGFHERGGNNMGADVGEIQGTTGKFTPGGNGDAWCEDYGQMGIAIIEDFFEVESPVLGSAHCMTTFRAAQKVPGLVSEVCEYGTAAVGKHGQTDNGHFMPVVKVLPNDMMLTSEGNTSISNIRDGDASGLKTRNQKVNGDLVTQGWIRIYPHNTLP